MTAFVAGTDTGVGKTYVTSLLARSLRAAGLDTIALKPVCCGDRDDALALQAACEGELDIDAVNPIHLAAPLAPLEAARRAGRTLDLLSLVTWFTKVSGGRRSVLVEGAGGWLAPLAPELSMADLAAAFGLPVLLVVANRLGCLNHTLLTLESIRARGLSCAGLILNSLPTPEGDLSPASNRAVLEEVSGEHVLFEISCGQQTLEIACA